MKLGKLRLGVFFVVVFVSGSTLGTLLSLHHLGIVMATKPDEASYELQLQYFNGTSITNYGWGEFSRGQMKQLDCQLVYLGNVKAKVRWLTTDFPSGWRVEVWDYSSPKEKIWLEGIEKSVKPGTTLGIRILLTEVDAIPDQQASFSLEFNSLTSRRKIKLG